MRTLPLSAPPYIVCAVGGGGGDHTALAPGFLNRRHGERGGGGERGPHLHFRSLLKCLILSIPQRSHFAYKDPLSALAPCAAKGYDGCPLLSVLELWLGYGMMESKEPKVSKYCNTGSGIM